MRRVLVIGIGAGDPEHLTLAAVRSMNEADVIFLIRKGDAHDGLRQHRLDLCHRFIEHPYRVVEIDDPERDRSASDYVGAVERWRHERALRYADAIVALAEDETGAFLVWGDPAVYDGTILMLEAVINGSQAEFDYEVVAGISSASALAARHRVPLNHAGEAVQMTTGRRLARDGLPPSVDNVVVMLDSDQAWRHLDDDVDIWWGAFIGTPDEILVSGRLVDVRATIEERRDEAHQRLGWMFDTYLLRRRARS